MILLDTDHLSVLRGDPSARRDRLGGRLDAARGPIGAPIVAVEQQMRGWLAVLAKERQARRQVFAYSELGQIIQFFSKYLIAPFDEPAADLFSTFGRIHISASDRKIAAIAVVQNALLLTANRRDFEQVPGLRFDNWMD